MSYSLVVSTSKSVGPNGGTTDPIDTSGANLLLAFVSWFQGIRDPDPLTDNKGNTWTRIRQEKSPVDWAYELFYVNGIPIVGSGHTFTSSNAFGNIFNAIGILAFSGATVPYESEAHSSGTSNTRQPGSVTPLSADALVTSFLMTNVAEAATIDSGFTRETSLPLVPGVSAANFTAYKIMGAKSAQNPTWSWTSSGTNAGINVVFTGITPSKPFGFSVDAKRMRF